MVGSLSQSFGLSGGYNGTSLVLPVLAGHLQVEIFIEVRPSWYSYFLEGRTPGDQINFSETFHQGFFVVVVVQNLKNHNNSPKPNPPPAIFFSKKYHFL